MKLISSTGYILALLLSIHINSSAQSNNSKFTIHQDFVQTSKCGVLITKYSRTMDIDSVLFQFSIRSKNTDSLLFILYNRKQETIFEETVKIYDGIGFRSYIPLNSKSKKPYSMRIGNYDTQSVEDYGILLPPMNSSKEFTKFKIQAISVFAGVLLFILI